MRSGPRGERCLVRGMRGVLAVLMVGGAVLAAAGPVSAQVAFSDLGSVPWAVPYIDDLAARGILQGTAPGVFDPNGVVTRAQLALVLARTWPSGAAAPAPTFADVAAGSALAGALRTAWPLMQPVFGRSDDFEPAAPVQRQDLFAILGRMLVPVSGTALQAEHQAAYVLEGFRDAAEVEPALAGWVAAAVATGIVQGATPDSLLPRADLTRAQMAVLIDRAAPGTYFGARRVTILQAAGG